MVDFRDDPKRQCRGKRKYARKADAKRMLRNSEALPGRDRLRAYRCPHCGHWHVGRKPELWKLTPAEPIETRYTSLIQQDPLGGGEGEDGT